MKVTIADKEIDFEKLFPVTIGAAEDFEKLMTDLGVEKGPDGEMKVDPLKLGIKGVVDFCTWAAHSIDESISRNDIRKLDVVKVNELCQWLLKKLGESGGSAIATNPPSSNSTTSSPGSTDGLPISSEN